MLRLSNLRKTGGRSLRICPIVWTVGIEKEDFLKQGDEHFHLATTFSGSRRVRMSTASSTISSST